MRTARLCGLAAAAAVLAVTASPWGGGSARGQTFRARPAAAGRNVYVLAVGIDDYLPEGFVLSPRSATGRDSPFEKQQSIRPGRCRRAPPPRP